MPPCWLLTSFRLCYPNLFNLSSLISVSLFVLVPDTPLGWIFYHLHIMRSISPLCNSIFLFFCFIVVQVTKVNLPEHGRWRGAAGERSRELMIECGPDAGRNLGDAGFRPHCWNKYENGKERWGWGREGQRALWHSHIKSGSWLMSHLIPCLSCLSDAKTCKRIECFQHNEKFDFLSYNVFYSLKTYN